MNPVTTAATSSTTISSSTTSSNGSVSVVNSGNVNPRVAPASTQTPQINNRKPSLIDAIMQSRIKDDVKDRILNDYNAMRNKIINNFG
jgi:hypothetical protein